MPYNSYAYDNESIKKRIPINNKTKNKVNIVPIIKILSAILYQSGISWIIPRIFLVLSSDGSNITQPKIEVRIKKPGNWAISMVSANVKWGSLKYLSNSFLGVKALSKYHVIGIHRTPAMAIHIINRNSSCPVICIIDSYLSYQQYLFSAHVDYRYT